MVYFLIGKKCQGGICLTEEKKRGRKYNYTLMLLMDSREGNVRQLRIDPVVVETFAAAFVVILIVLAVVCCRRGEELDLLRETGADQAAQIQALEKENSDLVVRQEELAQKVTVLSDTINRKVEEEEAKAEKEADAHMPVGFPMTSSASMEQVDGEEPMVKLTGSEPGSIVAVGAGVVESVTTGNDYLHCVRIDHGNGYVSIYRNDGEVMVREGDEIVRGSILYVIGEDNTELGYQVMFEEKYEDPMELLNIDG